jgi:hypothetical protein
VPHAADVAVVRGVALEREKVLGRPKIIMQVGPCIPVGIQL